MKEKKQSSPGAVAQICASSVAFTSAEVAQGKRGIRWVDAEFGVSGHPTLHHLFDFIVQRGRAIDCNCERCADWKARFAAGAGAVAPMKAATLIQKAVDEVKRITHALDAAQAKETALSGGVGELTIALRDLLREVRKIDDVLLPDGFDAQAIRHAEDALAAVDGENVAMDPEAPWQVDTWSGGRVVLQAHHGEHDTALIVNGDFADEAQKFAYARRLAARLNAAAGDKNFEHPEWYEAGGHGSPEVAGATQGRDVDDIVDSLPKERREKINARAEEMLAQPERASVLDHANSNLPPAAAETSLTQEQIVDKAVRGELGSTEVPAAQHLDAPAVEPSGTPEPSADQPVATGTAGKPQESQDLHPAAVAEAAGAADDASPGDPAVGTQLSPSSVLHEAPSPEIHKVVVSALSDNLRNSGHKVVFGMPAPKGNKS